MYFVIPVRSIPAAPDRAPLRRLPTPPGSDEEISSSDSEDSEVDVQALISGRGERGIGEGERERERVIKGEAKFYQILGDMNSFW